MNADGETFRTTDGDVFVLAVLPYIVSFRYRLARHPTTDDLIKDRWACWGEEAIKSELDHLRRMGCVSVDENGGWCVTAWGMKYISQIYEVAIVTESIEESAARDVRIHKSVA